MQRRVPVELLQLMENLFSCCYSKWDNILSEIFSVSFGVRQESIPSPFMFVLYFVDLAGVCDLNQSCSIFLYADDILLIAPTVSKLEAVVYYIFASVSCSGLI